MNILYTANDPFAAKVAAGICSIFENNKHVKELTVYILTDHMNTENKKNFQKLEKEYKRKFR